MVTTGMVLNIERFAIHDGPGIRTVVFLKGCPLRCVWCTAPDSQNLFQEMKYFVDKCVRCARCVEVCLPKAITVSDSGEILTDIRLCDNCDKCAEVCPADARRIAGKEMTVEEVIKEVEKDVVFYWNSSGGVTLSGGEPTMQPKFSLEILEACRDKGIHTAIETCAYVKWEVLDEMLNYVDFVFVDIKHISPEEHQKLVGVPNELILENVGKIAARNPDKPLVIRIPVIPGYNDSDENIAGIAQYISQLPGHPEIELLPYHKLGVTSYSTLFRDYALTEVESPSADHMDALGELVESYGVQVRIGG